MQTITKRVSTHEYRAEAVKLVIEQGMGATEAAKKPPLSVKTYSRWVREARAGRLVHVDTHRLDRELAIACEDRDILKKATALLLERAVAASRSSSGEVRF